MGWTVVSGSAARAAWLWLGALSLAACTGGVSSTDTSATVTASDFTVGGTVTGLSGSSLILQNNGGDNLPITADGSFTFATALIRGDSYSVTVLSEPTAPTQTCVITNGSGTVGTANVTGVAVVCANKTTTTDTIGGTAVGVLGSGLVLQDNHGDNLAVPSNGPFTFATALPSGTAYAISVLSPPVSPYQDCAIANGAGTTGGSNVTNIAVSCKTNTNPAYTIGGSVSGITGVGSLVLQDNGRDNLTVSADGPFQFAIPIPSGSTYNVTSLLVNGQQSQTCTFTNASGTVAASNVTNVSVACKANALVSVTVSGLNGGGLVLQDNGGDNLAIAGNGKATFATALPSGSAYKVTVLTQPPGQNCVVTNGTGTAVAGQTTPVTVACTTVGYTLGGTISGLVGTGLVLQNYLGDTLPVTGTGSVPFTFPTALPTGSPYSVSVLTQPITPYQTCTVTNGTGTIQTGNVNNVAVNCVTNSYTVGGTLTGLPNDPTTGLPYAGLSVQVNGGAAYAITTSPFTLPGTVDSGATYNVTIAGEPAGIAIACSVASGSGTIVNAPITNVAVTCIQTGGYLYVTNGGGNDISGFAIDYNTGVLSPLSQIVAPAGQPNAVIATTGTHPSSLVSSSISGNCVLGFSSTGNDYPLGLYVANSVSGTVSAFSMDTNTNTGVGGGALTLITSPSVAAGTAPGYIDYDQTDCAVFALNAGSGNISAYSALPPTGVPTATAGSPFAMVGSGHVPVAAVNATGVGANFSNTFEYVASQVTNDVSAYKVAPDGTLTLALSLVPPTANPIAAGTTPSAVVADVLTTNVAGANFPVAYVFVANQGSNSIFAYQGDSNTGLLNAPTSVATGNAPTSMALVRFQSGQPDLLYVANGADNTISAYSVQTAVTGTPGALTSLGVMATTGPGTHPVAMTYAFVGANDLPYLYVVNDQSNDLYVYQITNAVGGVPAFGSLTLVGKYAVGTAPTSVTVPFTQAGG